MKKFVKITTREGDVIFRNWIDKESIIELYQNSVTQEGLNEGNLVFYDYGMKKNKEVKIIAFNETIDSLNQL